MNKKSLKLIDRRFWRGASKLLELTPARKLKLTKLKMKESDTSKPKPLDNSRWIYKARRDSRRSFQIAFISWHHRHQNTRDRTNSGTRIQIQWLMLVWCRVIRWIKLRRKIVTFFELKLQNSMKAIKLYNLKKTKTSYWTSMNNCKFK